MSTLRVLFFASILGMAGCATMTQPSPEEFAAANYGTPISQDAAQQQILAFMNMTLKDPESARYMWGQISQGWIKDAVMYGGQSHFGYTLGVMVNAKNSFGGYTGAQPYLFLFQNGQLVRGMKRNSDGINERVL